MVAADMHRLETAARMTMGDFEASSTPTVHRKAAFGWRKVAIGVAACVMLAAIISLLF